MYKSSVSFSIWLLVSLFGSAFFVVFFFWYFIHFVMNEPTNVMNAFAK